MNWKLAEVIQSRRFRTLREVHTAVCKLDPGAISFSQFARLVNHMPDRLNLRLLLAICIVLNCGVGDLLVQTAAQPSEGDPHAQAAQ